jgi:SAM-dependent methyltransferase
VLDFASGYGRVARQLDRQQFDVTACDIHQAAVDFMRDEIGIDAFVSATSPSELVCDETYDVVFAFSFFTHMPETTFGDWLERLYRLVQPGGLLIFTTHGRISVATTGVDVVDGFGFWPGSEQEDIEASDYGTTVSLLPWVARTLTERTGQLPILFEEGSSLSGGKQDLVIVRKDAPYSALTEEDYVVRRSDLPALIEHKVRTSLEVQRQQYEKSTSWRITRPIRAVKGALSRGR